MNTLFISDLDGTLLDSSGSLSHTAKTALTQLIGAGMAFTVATGRTPLSVRPLFQSIPLNRPLVLMNGALILDPADWLPIEYTSLPDTAVRHQMRAQQELQLQRLDFGVTGGTLSLTLDGPLTGLWASFFRRNHVPAPSFSPPQCSVSAQAVHVLYSIYIDQGPDRLLRLRNRLAEHPAFALDYYQDRYDPDTWCLECFCKAASKRSAVERLRHLTNADRLVAFGDSLNDLPLFEACEERYAVANAIPEVRALADAIVDSHQEDGVIRYLQSRWKHEALL